MAIFDSTNSSVFKHIVANFVIGAAGLAAAFLMDFCADLARDWHRSPTVVFGCHLLANWLFILDLAVIIGSATIGSVRILRRLR
jgi:hypothetical protein